MTYNVLGGTLSLTQSIKLTGTAVTWSGVETVQERPLLSRESKARLSIASSSSYGLDKLL